MPCGGEDPPYVEPEPQLDELARSVIGTAIEVHRRLGPGLYHHALRVELRLRQIRFARQVEVPVTYKGQLIGKRKLDLLIGGRLTVELKAVEVLAALHAAQVRSSLEITHLTLGPLINFNTIVLKDGIRRVINPI